MYYMFTPYFFSQMERRMQHVDQEIRDETRRPSQRLKPRKEARLRINKIAQGQHEQNGRDSTDAGRILAQYQAYGRARARRRE